MEASSLSAIVLAGGYSSRMGQSKAELLLCGKRFIDRQIDKLRALEIDDIMLSGYDTPVEGTRFVPDVYPHKGPLSGLHACFAQAKHPYCLVLTVDTPLLPLAALQELITYHKSGVTLLLHGEKFEPLIAVYDCALYPRCEEILQGEKYAIRKLLDSAEVHYFPYSGNEAFLRNCNTPEDYAAVCELAAQEG